MRTIKWLSLATMGIMMLSSCNKSEVECPDNPLGRQSDEVQFTSSIDTRAVDSRWSAGDAIGIYAIPGEGALTVAVKANAKHTTGDADGKFTAAIDNDKIKKAETEAYSYIAYYPYKADLADNIYTIDLSNQSNMEAIDLLYANNVKNSAAMDVALKFKHMLSQVRFEVAQGTDKSALNNLLLNVENAIVDGKMPLATGVVEKGEKKQTIAATVQGEATKATCTVLLMPGQDLKDLTFVFKVNGKTYKQQITESKVMESSKRYVYEVKINLEGAEMKPVNFNNATIDDWNTENGAPINLTPEKEGGDTPNEGGEITPVGSTDIVLTDAAAATREFQFNAPEGQAWTATVSDNAAWLTVAPANGTGNGKLTLTVAENTTENERTATVTVAPTAATRAAATPLTITVKQPGKKVTPTPDPEPQPTQNLVFPGSDFEDWAAFTGSINNALGLDATMCSHAKGEGRNGGSAIRVKGSGNKNGYLFSNLYKDENPLNGKSKVTFYVKGTSKGKSLSININTEQTKYTPFNVENLDDQDATIQPTERNGYNGSIDTKGKWVKVTLDISSLTIAKTNDYKCVISFKFGKEAAYDLLIDDITFE